MCLRVQGLIKYVAMKSLNHRVSVPGVSNADLDESIFPKPLPLAAKAANPPPGVTSELGVELADVGTAGLGKVEVPKADCWPPSVDGLPNAEPKTPGFDSPVVPLANVGVPPLKAPPEPNALVPDWAALANTDVPEPKAFPRNPPCPNAEEDAVDDSEFAAALSDCFSASMRAGFGCCPKTVDCANGEDVDGVPNADVLEGLVANADVGAGGGDSGDVVAGEGFAGSDVEGGFCPKTLDVPKTEVAGFEPKSDVADSEPPKAGATPALPPKAL